MNIEKDLGELVERLKRGAGENLRAVVLYGSAARGEFHPSHSNLNVLCIVAEADAASLRRMHPAAEWWERKGHPAPLVFTLEELTRAADVFAIELLDIQAHRRVLYGEDLLAGIHVPLERHGRQVERELRNAWVRLRQRFLVAPADNRRLVELMTASVSTFLALFRHVLIVFGEQPPEGSRAAVDRLAARVGFKAEPFLVLLDVREGKRKANAVNAAGLMGNYLEAIERVLDQLDRQVS